MTEDGRYRARVRVGSARVVVGEYDSAEEARRVSDEEIARLRAKTSPLLGPSALTYRDYADRIGVPHGTIKRWAGEGMPVSKVGQFVRVDPEAADAWVAEHKANSVSLRRVSVVSSPRFLCPFRRSRRVRRRVSPMLMSEAKSRAGHGIRTRDIQLGKLGHDSNTTGKPTWVQDTRGALWRLLAQVGRRRGECRGESLVASSPGTASSASRA